MPSYVRLPEGDPPYPAMLDFLDARFPNVGREVWRERLRSGKISTERGEIVTEATAYRPSLLLRYFREVPEEPPVPFDAQILFQNEHLLIACKPHFLPVTPAGAFVNHCLLYHLTQTTGLRELAPLHRIDRETAGLVMFSVNPQTRGIYHQLFTSGDIRKMYEAVAALPPDAERTEWLIESRIEVGEPWFRVKNVAGKINAASKITLLARRGDYGYFRLEPLTGKQHQLRAHLLLIGSHILHDRCYPELQPKQPDDPNRPLQLLAKSLQFIDPISGEAMAFESSRRLLWPINGAS